MSKLDQFESAFKSAAKEQYRHSAVTLAKILVVTDLDESDSMRFCDDVKAFLDAVQIKDGAKWVAHHTTPDGDVGDLLGVVEREQPDLICSYRNLHGRARHYPFSLGAHIDVLTQATSTPVLLLPPPTDEGRLDPSCRRTQRVLILTDHLQGSDSMIDYGAHFATSTGSLVLTHLEDDGTFERYMGVIGKIASIDTEDARMAIAKQLLKEPADYMESVRAVLRKTIPELNIATEVAMGHRVQDCLRLIEANDIELVVVNTKDEDQLAMHGLAYPLAIELRAFPLLML